MRKQMTKRVLGIALCAVMLLSLAVPYMGFAAADTSVTRVMLQTLGTPSSVGFKVLGEYNIPELTALDVPRGSDMSIANKGGTLYVVQGGKEYPVGAKVTLKRYRSDSSANYLQLNANGYRYLGDMVFHASGSGIQVVNHVYTEHYLYGVLAGEIGNSWGLEATKTMAVAARSFVVNKIRSRAGAGVYDLVDTDSDQVYLGYNAAWGNIIAAVDATKGQVASYNGSVIELNYSSSNGGYTELPKNVWGGSASGAPYFVVKEDPYDLAATRGNKGYEATHVFAKDQQASPMDSRLRGMIASDLKSKGINLDDYDILSVDDVQTTSDAYPGTGSPVKEFVMVTLTLRSKTAVNALMAPAPSDPDEGAEPSGEPTASPSASPSASGEPTASPSASPSASGEPTASPSVSPSPSASPSASGEPTASPSASPSASGEPSASPSASPEADQALMQDNQGVMPIGGTTQVTAQLCCNYNKRGTYSSTSFQAVFSNKFKLYTVEQSDSAFTVYGRRGGHGVGISQMGLRQMGKDGKSYAWMLDFYYPGVKTTSVSMNEPALDVKPGTSGNLPDPSDPDPRIGTAVVTTQSLSLNLRSGPGTSYAVIGKLNRGQTVDVLEQGSAFTKVRTDGGMTGWASNEYLKVTLDETPAPTPTPTPATPTPTPATPTPDPVGTGTVTASALNMRAGAGTGYKVLRTLSRGATVTVLSQQGEWYYIDYNGQKGYVSATYLDVSGGSAPDPTTGTGTVTASSLRVRSGPGTGYATLRTLPKGTTVSVLGKSGDWYQISYGGSTGYVSAEYLEVSGGSIPTPDPDPDPMGTGTVTASSLNVRSGPGTGYGVVGGLTRGVKVTLLDKSGDWYLVQYNRVKGYVSATYISVDGSGGSSGGSTTDPATGTGTVTASSLRVRSGPGTGYATLRTLPRGTTVTVLGKSGDWVQISYGGSTGYVSAEYLEVSGSGGGTGTVTASALNLRKGAGTGYGVIRTIPRGATVTILGSSGDWYQVSYGGSTGYVSKTYVK
ncbi:MAG: SH3 domain-containing protein [Christensenellales bacterium]|jgi:uncharacterized protein YgiM (DUF1202 family)/peptidoglycan hydrolase-like amidase